MSELSDVNVGDLVALYGSYNTVPILRRVTKVTKTQIVIPRNGNGSEWRFRRDSGWEVGGDRWGRTSIRLLTDEVRTTIKRHAAIEKLRGTNWGSLSNEQLDIVLTALCSSLESVKP